MVQARLADREVIRRLVFRGGSRSRTVSLTALRSGSRRLSVSVVASDAADNRRRVSRTWRLPRSR